MNSRIVLPFVFFTFILFGLTVHTASACTSMLVTKGASADGAVMITYTADAAGFYSRLIVMPAEEHPEGTVIEVPATDDRPAGAIKQVPKTYHVIGVTWDPEPAFRRGAWLKQGLINEHQLAITESTFGGRPELINPQGLTGYSMLITLALQRSKTAREAIAVMTSLADEYGFHDTGESFSIADTEEAWVLELIGTGNRPIDPNGGNVVWVARKVPDGEISAHANAARIGELPDTPDQDSFFWSDNIRSFAIEQGFYDPASGEPFRFNYAYDLISPRKKRLCEARVWSMLRRAAPSLELSADYHRGNPNAKPYPWSVKPDQKLTLSDVMALKRDHYEGTDFDMTKGLDAGPWGMPKRWRPFDWRLEGDENEYFWERPISIQQTGYSVVSQSRSNLPDFIGGVLWYGVDDTYTTCYFPLYCQITDVPKPFARGSIHEFSWDSAWWVFNLVANYAKLKFNRIAPEILKVQQELESEFISRQPGIEQQVVSSPNARQQLTEISISKGEQVFTRWQQLATRIFTKFNDGFIQEDNVTYDRAGDPYPDSWLRSVVNERPEQFKLPD